MLLYGSDPLEVATPNMTDYITLQDAEALLTLLGQGAVSVATDTNTLPVSRAARGAGFWRAAQSFLTDTALACGLPRDLIVTRGL